jgi:hypothetical protein
MMKVNRLFAASVAIALLSAPAAAQKPPLIPSFVLSITHKLERLPDTSASGIMKREFGFTKAYITPLAPARNIQNPGSPATSHVPNPVVMLGEASHAQRFAKRLCCAAAAWQLMHRMLANSPSTYG